jgi:integrase
MPEFVAALTRRNGISARALQFLDPHGGSIRRIARDALGRDRPESADLDRAARSHEGSERASSSVDGWCGRSPRHDRTPDALVFPSPTHLDRPLSDMTLAAVLKKMARTDITVHGFRSTFRDWAGETTNFPREVIEAALAHHLKDKAEAAYARGDLFTKRRALMEAWQAFTEEH